MKKNINFKKLKSFGELTLSCRFFICFVVGLMIVLFLLASYSFYYRERTLPNTTISGLKVGGLKKSELESRVGDYSRSFVNSTIQIQYQDKSWDVKLHDFGTKVEYSIAVNQAYAYGKSGSVATQFIDLFFAPITRQNFDVDIQTFSEDGKIVFQDNILESIEKRYQETAISIQSGKVTVKAGQKGLELNINKYEQDLFNAYKRGSASLSLHLNEKEPLITPEEAEPARNQIENILSKDWVIKTGEENTVISSRELAKWIKTEVMQDGLGLLVVLDEEKINNTVASIAQKVNKKAVNARVKLDNLKLVVDGRGENGLNLNQTQLIQLIKTEMLSLDYQNMKYVVDFAPDVVVPEVSQNTLDELGIKELVGTATTDYSGSPANRKTNINVGQRSLNGILVKDGEVFSTTSMLGVVDETTGYLPELVIKNNRTIPEYGGGLCQVSTTLFRAVLNAGLPVIERTNHSYRVGYYERGVGPGLDATVYIPSPDLKWKNDLGKAVLVQAYIKENKITFELYGTKDGRVSNISAPVILEEVPSGAPIYIKTDTMFVDEKKQIETAHNGAKTEVVYTVNRDGKQITRQVFRSNYKPWPAQYLVGTKERNPAELSPTNL